MARVLFLLLCGRAALQQKVRHHHLNNSRLLHFFKILQSKFICTSVMIAVED
jgi:hypothetical protein